MGILDKLVEAVDKIGNEQSGETENKKKTGEETIKTTDADANDGTPMSKLLAKHPITIPRVGDVMEGIVVSISSNSVLIDLGQLGTGIVIGKEIRDGLNAANKLKKGDVVSATLMDLENEDGHIELSIREASYGKSWEDLESKRDNQEIITAKTLDANKGGLMVEINGISGFLPVSQLSSEHYPRVEDGDKNKILEILKKLVGEELQIKIIDVDQVAEKLIVSEKAAISEKEREIISQMNVGDIVSGEISGVVDFGAFVKFLPPAKKDSSDERDKMEGLVHISELDWQLIGDPRKVVKTGDKVKAQIIGIDDTRVSLSLKMLKTDPWTQISEKYKAGDVVKGKVDKINPFGAFVYLDKDIHGLAHVSEFREIFSDKKMDEVLKTGESYDWKILSIEPKEHRMGLMFVKNETEKEKTKKKKDEKAEKK